jgi:hypothetical protein
MQPRAFDRALGPRRLGLRTQLSGQLLKNQDVACKGDHVQRRQREKADVLHALKLTCGPLQIDECDVKIRDLR